MRPEAYEQRLAAEQDAYSGVVDVHALPPVFHYWSNKYVRPLLEACGFVNAEELFAKYFASAAERIGGAPRFLSLGAGNCDVEVRTAQLLRQAGLNGFVLECLDVNPAMLARGAELATASGVRANMAFIEGDFNRWTAGCQYAGIAAHQSLHHVFELEHLFAAVRSALHPDGYFVSDDMIGRNGHQRWPEALGVLRPFWRELPLEYRWNWLLRRLEEEYINHDCADEAFEGIRAQDVLPLLLRHFDFQVFIAFGNLIDVFVDRTFGWNFDAGNEWDCDFIDRVQAADERAILSGALTPTHMFAVMTPGPCAQHVYSRGLAPERCVRGPGQRPMPERLAIATPSLRGLGSRRVSLTACGGVPPYRWSAEGLPAGIVLDAQGRLSGLMESSGVSAPLITVTDSAMPPATAAQRYTTLNSASEQALDKALLQQKRGLRRAGWILRTAWTQVKYWLRGYFAWKYTRALLELAATPELLWSPRQAARRDESTRPL